MSDLCLYQKIDAILMMRNRAAIQRVRGSRETIKDTDERDDVSLDDQRIPDFCIAFEHMGLLLTDHIMASSMRPILTWSGGNICKCASLKFGEISVW